MTLDKIKRQADEVMVLAERGEHDKAVALGRCVMVMLRAVLLRSTR